MTERPKLTARIESAIAGTSLLLLALLPLLQVVVRLITRGGIPGYNSYLYHLVLMGAFLGGMITAREGRHLAIRVAADALPDRGKDIASTITGFLSAALGFGFFWASLGFVAVGFEPGSMVGVVPIQLFAALMPIGFLFMTIRFMAASPRTPLARVLVVAGALLGTFLGVEPAAGIVYWYASEIPPIVDALVNAWYIATPVIAVPLAILLVLGAFLGVPLFLVLGGVAFLLFARVGGSVSVVANEGYEMLTGESIPAIPLFTLAGFFLSESKAGERLVRLFRAFFGWLPGGLVIAAVLASTFFTTFTGASGVTILALGGLLYYVLVESGHHDDRFATGLLTGSGSIGLLFPPSLALIVYGSVAQVSIFDLFLGGILPGLLLVLAMGAVGVVVAIRRKIPSVAFSWAEAWAALRESALEIALPVIIVVVYFAGIATLVETAAIAVLYTIFVEVVIRREIRFKELFAVASKALTIIGGVLMILALARALSYYIIDTQIPSLLSAWVADTISSRFVFLLLVNLVLLLAGMFMDIFSAILVIAPLIIPLGGLFGIDPVHLGIIFVANMGIGFITPPVGLNLFLAAYRFEMPLSKIYRNVVPFFLLQLAIVLVVTYWPWLSTAFVRS